MDYEDQKSLSDLDAQISEICRHSCRSLSYQNVRKLTHIFERHFILRY